MSTAWHWMVVDMDDDREPCGGFVAVLTSSEQTAIARAEERGHRRAYQTPEPERIRLGDRVFCNNGEAIRITNGEDEKRARWAAFDALIDSLEGS